MGTPNALHNDMKRFVFPLYGCNFEYRDHFNTLSENVNYRLDYNAPCPNLNPFWEHVYMCTCVHNLFQKAAHRHIDSG